MTTKARILIVDDESHILSALNRLFRSSGYEAVTCSSAREALEIIEKSEPFQIVISGYRMPKMNGIEFLSLVRYCSPDSLRFLLSENADAGLIIEAANEGHIYKFIPKPWNDEVLLASVADTLNYYTFRLEQRSQITAQKSDLNRITTPPNGEEHVPGYKDTTAAVRILVVDDEENILNSLKRLFRPSGYETVACTSAQEALELIGKSEPFHLVISDYRMPEMNGVEFLKEVKSCSPDSVRMVLSGFADAGSIIAMTNERHIYKFIPKPWDDAILLDSVTDAINYYTSRQEQHNLITAQIDSNREHTGVVA